MPHKLKKVEPRMPRTEPMEPMYPIFDIDLEHLPEAKDWKVGDKYRLEMVVKQKRLDEERVCFEIHKVGGSEYSGKKSENNPKNKRYPRK